MSTVILSVTNETPSALDNPPNDASIEFSTEQSKSQPQQYEDNNRSIENRFRPIYLHIPDQFLEICEPQGYESRNNAQNI